MRILMVSMNSIHFRRWTSQLKDAGHEVYWFDILGAGGNIKELDWVSQKTDWRLRIQKGRYLLKKIPFLKKFIERDVAKSFENYVVEIQPDIVHSFVLYMSCVPILNVMKKYTHIKWLYSAWGNDLYFYQHDPKYKKGIDLVLPHLDYMFADCKRDLILAEKLGFKGKSLGDYPGGGGYHFDLIEEDIKPISEREGILVKGYQGEKHRGLNVLKALEKMPETPKITFFSTDHSLIRYYNSSESLKKKDITFFTQKEGLNHKELCRLMNRSLIYIGNNLSDGMPNTMLEAICFGAFPIQSNPGGASAEIIDEGINGLLIENCEDIDEIAHKLEESLTNDQMLQSAFENNMKIRTKLAYSFIRKQVLNQYDLIEKNNS
ncbi:glycosyltransferase [Dokdonia sp.]|uniref:glycosyltransferase n=1 Tax=Dokdonia sp. TaxID=2024995 RepID=UPI003263BA4D